jgi:hypothetical protein
MPYRRKVVHIQAHPRHPKYKRWLTVEWDTDDRSVFIKAEGLIADRLVSPEVARKLGEALIEAADDVDAAHASAPPDTHA